MAKTNNRWWIYTLSDDAGSIRYVGKTKRPSIRFHQHLRLAEKGGNSYLARWLNVLHRKGKAPTFEIIDAGNGEGWRAAERAWIAHHRERGARLVNSTDGGEGTYGFSRPHRPETKAKISASLTGQKRGHLSAEHKAKLSVACTGQKMSPEAIEKTSAAKRGKPRSAETRKKLSDALLGRTLSDEHRAKIAAGLLRHNRGARS